MGEKGPREVPKNWRSDTWHQKIITNVHDVVGSDGKYRGFDERNNGSSSTIIPVDREGSPDHKPHK